MKLSVLGAPFRALRKFRLFNEIFDYVVNVDGSILLKIKGDIHVATTGEFRVTSAKDVVLLSGQNPNPERPGYVHAIWENPPLDEEGRPLMMIPVTHSETGEMKYIPARFTHSGKLKLPAGWIAPPEFYPEAQTSRLTLSNK